LAQVTYIRIETSNVKMKYTEKDELVQSMVISDRTEATPSQAAVHYRGQNGCTKTVFCSEAL